MVAAPALVSRKKEALVLQNRYGPLDQPNRVAHQSKHVCVVAMRICVGVAASPSEVVEVACEGRRGQISARARRLGARLEIRVKGTCAGTTPASPGRVAAAGTSHQRAVKSRRHACGA